MLEIFKNMVDEVVYAGYGGELYSAKYRFPEGIREGAVDFPRAGLLAFEGLEEGDHGVAGDLTAKLFLVEEVHALQVCLIVNEHFAGFWNDLFDSQ